MTNWCDTHIHLDAPELNGQGLDLLPAAQKCGINKFVVPGVLVSSWDGMVALAENAESVYLAPGLHPAYADQWTPEAEQLLQYMTASQKVVAIGEIGLDGSVKSSMQQQEVVLRAQLQIALDARLPVLLHARQATGQLLAILRELEIGKKIGGSWHGFSGSLQVAQELAELGFKIGVGPILLRANARKLPDAVKALPTSALVLETDLPYMAEKPEIILKVAEKVAELRHCSLAETARFTTENANKLFGFQDRSIYGK
ncbi:MAG: TatD family hydrolase [Desulfuromusa sp.]|jgi:TatD DNase family protein|nr:TatD family hydrolase [Desulfuromusa sp.]